MGTSLSGLTPATTFDGLLKTSDNDGLTTTRKTIGTGDGNDSQLKISTITTQIGNIEFVSGNVIATVSPSTNLRIVSGGIAVNGDYSNPTANTRLHIKGSGATSATTSLLVQNSAGDTALKINDDKGVFIYSGLKIFDKNVLDVSGGSLIRYYYQSGAGNHAFYTNSGTERMRLNDDGNLGIGETTPTARLHVKAGTTQDVIARFQDPLQTWSYIDIKNDSVLTDYTGIFWGSKAKIRSKEVGPIFMDCSGGISFLDGNSAKSNINSQGAIAIGATAAPSSTMAYIKGSGATSATTALLVENSAGTDLLKVNDAGEIGFGASPTSNTRAYIKSAGSTPATSALLVQNSLSTNLFKVQSDGKVYATNLRSSQYSSYVELLSDVDFSGADNYTFNSTTGGFLPPRMTTTERDAITTPAAGLMVYNTTTNKAQCYNGTAWQDLF